jgi:hypothetical protein
VHCPGRKEGGKKGNEETLIEWSIAEVESPPLPPADGIFSVNCFNNCLKYFTSLRVGDERGERNKKAIIRMVKPLKFHHHLVVNRASFVENNLGHDLFGTISKLQSWDWLFNIGTERWRVRGETADEEGELTQKGTEWQWERFENFHQWNLGANELISTLWIGKRR